MKTKINVVVYILYTAAFYKGFIDLLPIDNNINSFMLLLFDIVILYIGLYNKYNSILNIFFLISILFITFINYTLHDYSFVSYLNGLREIISLVLIFSFYESVCKSKYNHIFNKKIFRFIRVFLFAQLPITLFQFIKYGAGDKVGGSLGTGSSGILTLVTVPMVYILIKENRYRVGFKAYYNALFLIPLFLNETKISFLLIPLMFLFLVDYKNIKAGFLSILLGITVFFLLNTLYSDQGKTRNNPFSEMFNKEFLELYLLNEVEPGEDIPRFRKIIFASQATSSKVENFLVGLEVGAFKGGKLLNLSDFSKQYSWLLLGSRPYMFYLLISGGWILFFLFNFYILKKLFFRKGKFYDMNFILLLSSICLTILLYNDSFRSQFFNFNFVYFVLLGKGYFAKKFDLKIVNY